MFTLEELIDQLINRLAINETNRCSKILVDLNEELYDIQEIRTIEDGTIILKICKLIFGGESD